MNFGIGTRSYIYMNRDVESARMTKARRSEAVVLTINANKIIIIRPSCKFDELLGTHSSKLCVILRSRVLLCLCPH